MSTEQIKKEYEFVVSEDDSGVRLDKYLATQLPEISRSKIKKLIENYKVQIDGTTLSECSYQVKPEQSLKIEIEENKGTSIKPQKIDFGIIYEDNDLLVIDKPVGLTVHPGAGNTQNTLVNALIDHCGDSLSSIAGEARPGIVHRLDKDTSGLLLVAKNDFTHMKLSEQLSNREIKRTYFALVYGIPNPPIGTIKTGIGKSKRDHKTMVVQRGEGSREAITHYKIIKTYFDCISQVECNLETGRTHQIRVHMDHKKTPIIGDMTYGRSKNFNLNNLPDAAKDLIKKLKHQALHAKQIEFVHPRTEEVMSFESKLPQDLKTILSLLE